MYSCHSHFTGEELEREISKLAGWKSLGEREVEIERKRSDASVTIKHLILPRRTWDKDRNRRGRAS